MLAILSGLWWTGRSDGRLHLLFPVQPGDGILVKGSRGEIAVVVGGAPEAAPASIDVLVAEVRTRADAGERLKEAVAGVAEASGVPKRELYAAALAARGR